MARTSRQRILDDIREALQKQTEKPVPKPDFSLNIYTQSIEEHKEVIFAESFSKNKSDFYYCEDLKSFHENLNKLIIEREWKDIRVWEKDLENMLPTKNFTFITDDLELDNIEVGITLCESLLARTGSIIVSSKQTAGRRLTIFPPVHIVVAFTKQVFEDMEGALTEIQKRYQFNIPSMLSIITGPSQTADIEKTLVLGAHGPKELILFLIDE